MQKDIFTQFSTNKHLNELETVKLLYEHKFQVQEQWEGFLSDREIVTLQTNKYLNKERLQSLDFQFLVTQYYLVQLKSSYLEYDCLYNELDKILSSYFNMGNFLTILNEYNTTLWRIEASLLYLIPLWGYAFMKHANEINTIHDFYNYSSIMHSKTRILELLEQLQILENSIKHFASLGQESSMFQEQSRFPEFYDYYFQSLEFKKNQIQSYCSSIDQLYHQNWLYFVCDIIEPVLDHKILEYDEFLSNVV